MKKQKQKHIQRKTWNNSLLQKITHSLKLPCRSTGLRDDLVFPFGSRALQHSTLGSPHGDAQHWTVVGIHWSSCTQGGLLSRGQCCPEKLWPGVISWRPYLGKKSQISSLLLQSKTSMSVPCPVRNFLKMSSRDVFYRPSVKTLFNCCWASAGHRPYSWAIWDFLFNGSMVQSICDCSTVQSAVCLSKCLADRPVFLLGATCHFVWLSCKVCTEIVVYQMFAVFLNSPNGKNSWRSIVQNIFSVYFFYSRFQD